MPVSANGALLAGRYRVLAHLGTGGAATVFLCKDERLGRRVAVKRMHAHSPEDITRRLRREAQLGAALNHPNLVSIYDTVTYDEGVLIVMEYVEGETLADALTRGPLDRRRAVEVTRAVAAALDHAHAQGIVHRDVKPANVLLGTDGSVKLADLGVGTAADNTRITTSGMVLGTPAYMSPEQVDGARPTPAVDIYALGAVAYELLSGEKARRGSTPLELAHRVATEPPPDLRRVWRDAPPAAAEAIKRAMARDPARRPSSAGELAEELADALSGESTAVTRPLTSPTRPAPAAPTPPAVGGRRLPRWAPLLALAVVLGVAALVILTSGGGSSSGPAKSSGHRAGQQQTHQAGGTAKGQQTRASSDDPSALNAEGKSLIDSGHPAQAIPILQRAVAAYPPDQHSSIPYGYALFNLADAYLRSGQPEKAIPLLRERLKIPDQTATVQAELQQAEQRAGLAPSGGKPEHGKKKGHHKG